MRYLLRLSFCLLLMLCTTFSVAQTKREPLKLLRVTPAGEDVPLSAQIVRSCRLAAWNACQRKCRLPSCHA
jgi:hypothetical protein